jgi:hypothetical protein
MTVRVEGYKIIYYVRDKEEEEWSRVPGEYERSKATQTYQGLLKLQGIDFPCYHWDDEVLPLATPLTKEEIK